MAPRKITRDCSDITSLADLYDVLSVSLQFPDYYGRNKDAFWDCLSEIDGQQAITITGIGKIPECMRSEVNSYITMMKEYGTSTAGKFSVEIV